MKITLLDNKKTIANLVEVDIHDSILEQVKKDLEKDEFNFVVTNDNLKFAKDKMADLNKSIKFIDTFRKDKVSVESVAIDLFKKNVKEYLALIDAKRDEIKKNVEVFERETKDSILKELSLYSEEFIKLQNIREMFIEVDIADLIKLTSVTARGALTKGAKEAIESRVNVCKSKQDKYDMRLMQLENESYKAGLESPLTITHIQGIISLDSDAEYQKRLEDLISTELDRQETMKSNLQKKSDSEAQQKVLDEQNRIKDFYRIDFNGLDLAGTDTLIAGYSSIDYSTFNDFEPFARSFVGEQISKLNFHRNDLLKKANDLLADMESKQKPNIEIVEENIPFTQEEKHDQVKEVAANRKIVRINAVFEVEVPAHVSSDAVLNKVRSRLSDCDINSDTLKSLEVI